MKKTHKGITIISLIVGILASILFCLNMTIILQGIIHPSTPPSLFGTTPMVVLSGSMSGTAKYPYKVDAAPSTKYALINENGQTSAEGTSTTEGKLTFWNVKAGQYTLIKYTKNNKTEEVQRVEIKDEWMDVNIQPGDLIFVHKTPFETLQTGDIISFMDATQYQNGEIKYTMVTHRIIEKTTNINGDTAYRTKGDANPIYDEDLVTENIYVGTYSKKIQGLGNVILFFQKPVGIILILVFAITGITIVTLLSKRHKKTSVEEENEQLKKELAQLKANGNPHTNLTKGDNTEHV